MESTVSVTQSEIDESIAGNSLAFDSSASQPKFDSLLDKLRKGMSELTSKGDDFTKQMFQMYNTLEDIVHSSKMNDNNSQSLDQIFVTNNTNSIDRKSKTNTLKSVVIKSDENLFKANLKSNICESNQTIHSSLDSNDFYRQNSREINFNNNNNIELISMENKRQNKSSNNQSINSLNTFSSNSSSNVSDCDQQTCNNNNNVNKVLNQLSVNPKSDLMIEKSVVNTTEEPKSMCLEELDKTNGYMNRNCFNNSEHIVNPLLDTINTLNSCSDSSDECDINKKCYSRGERHRRILNGSRPLNRKSCNYYYSSSDGDSVSGYTGTNSLESGYKSDYLSNTPEVIDGSSLSSFSTALDCMEPSVISCVTDSVNHAISHQMTDNESTNTLKKRNKFKQTLNSMNNSSTKPPLESNVCNSNKSNKTLTENVKQNQISDDVSSNGSIDSFKTNSSATNNSRKSVGMFSEKIANRLKAFNNDSQLDHLLKLRKSLLKALKKCEQISSPVTSRDGSPITASIPLSSSRSSSPASTVVKSSQYLTTNARRLRDEMKGSEKYRQKAVPSPQRPHEEIDCNQMSINLDIDCNTNANNIQNQSKSVRFNSSVKISSLSNPSFPSLVNRKQQQISGNYVSNKSILKDPLCETLRSAIKAGEFKNNCSLEGEIDELLYGRTGDYYPSPQLQCGGHLGDDCISPSSAYVTMIEEKYRTFNANTSAGHTGKQCTSTTAATSKKSVPNSTKDYSTLKTGFSSSMSANVSSLSKANELDLDLITTSELRINATLSSTTTARPKSSPYSIYGTTYPIQSSSTYGTKTNRKSTKSQFTEMAKCMLEILDDLQVPHNNENSTYKHSSARLRQSLLTNSSECDSIDLLMKELSVGHSDTSDLSDISSLSYRTLPEQHIYEEILYDCLESQPKDSKLYTHFLPSRRAITSTMNTYAHSTVNGIRVDAPLHQSHIKHMGSWGRTSNKPKQRSNLYTIFSDESERRNISRSLEREFCKRKTNDFNPNKMQSFVDNYGFEA